MAFKLNFYFHPKAIDDLNTAIEWYQGISSTLAKQFFFEIETKIQLALKYPEAFSFKYGCRRILINKFPYIIFFNVVDQDFVVIAIFHCSKNPIDSVKSITEREH